eukprot:TRINITY_DN891_c0_g1_i1.p2 TRINITY_DN891_c0_g1~~TRINITY_DN891_c0_g1_i1.p2  ORF type:complete len:332 (+),score=140.11 TRINITY_DN891_c0_g1_i1:53-997(+)
MSKVIPFVAGSAAKTAVVDAASKVLSSVGVTLKSVSVAEAAGELSSAKFAAGAGLTRSDIDALSKATGQSFHSKVINTASSAALNPDQTYADSTFALVRAFGPASDNAVSPLDRVDKFPKMGVPVAQDIALVEASFKKTADAAVQVAKDAGAARITVLQKPQSAFKEQNALFLTAIKAAAPEGIAVEVQTSQQVYNNAVMFSKTLGVVVTPDYAAGDHIEGITTGVAGGSGLATESLHSETATIFAQPKTDSQNPTGLLLAAAGALKAMGQAAEAGKIEAALKKVYSGKSGLPSDVQGGNADAAAFAKAVSAAL